MYERTLTIFNLHGGSWYPTTVDKCDMKVKLSSNLTVNGINDVGSVTIVIHCSRDKKVRSHQGVKQYLPPKEYAELVNPKPDGFYTFTPEVDFIYEGGWDSAKIDDDDYDSGFYHYMNAKKDGIHMIQACQYFTLLPHYEISAK